jgi:hypothetical protein
MPERATDPLFNSVDEWVAEAARGCCGDESWRGRFCEYHRGYRDGLYALAEKVDDDAE